MNARGATAARRSRGLASVVAGAALFAGIMVAVPVPASAALSSGTTWGWDTASFVDSSFLQSAQSTYGAPPAFVGRYIDTSGQFSPMSANEASFLRGQGISLLLVADAGHAAATGYAAGQADANQAISEATNTYHVPGGVAIFHDVETGDPIDTAFVEGWMDTFAASSYRGGFYENPINGNFAGAYCGAVSANSAYANAALYASEPDYYSSSHDARTGPSGAPAWAPDGPPCANDTVAWQYAIRGGYGTPNVDTDEALASAPLWGTLGDGTFIQISGHPEVYRIAGGAPLYVSTWNTFGGPQPVVTVSQAQFDALRHYPSDGTFIRDATDGRVYKTAGGAPEYVSAADANQVPGYGTQPVIDEDHWEFANFAHLRRDPADGTFISDVDDGRVYRVAGGAPEYVSAADASELPGWGTQPVIALSSYEFSAYEHLRHYPRSHTFVCDVNGGYCYEIAGGAPVYVTYAGSTSIPGWSQGPVTTLSDYEFVNREHLRRHPIDGTFITGAQTSRVYRVKNGVAHYVPSWTAYGGPQPTVVVDQTSIDDAQRAIPWNGLVSGTPRAHMLGKSTLATTNRYHEFRWSGPIQSSALTSFDVRYRIARTGQSYGAWVRPSKWQKTPKTSWRWSLSRDHSYQLEVRGHDVAGETGDWSAAVTVRRT